MQNDQQITLDQFVQAELNKLEQESALMPKVTVTSELIDSGRSGTGGWNMKQIQLLGISWPLTKGWKSQAIGREITKADAELFVSLRGKCKRKSNDVEEAVAKPSAKDIAQKIDSAATILDGISRSFGRLGNSNAEKILKALSISLQRTSEKLTGNQSCNVNTAGESQTPTTEIGL